MDRRLTTTKGGNRSISGRRPSDQVPTTTASTTGAMDHSGTIRASCFSSRRRRERIVDRVDAFLKDDLLRGMLELLMGQPAPMRQRPVAAASVNPAVPEQEGKQLLAFAAKIVRCRLAGADKIAHRLMSRVGRPHPRQFARPMQPRQRHRVAPVRLDPLARPFRDQRRSDHQAIVAERLHLAIKPVSRRPGFEADMQQVVPVRQSLDRLLEGLFSTSPRNRTSPCRPPSAIATACFFLATSKETKASLCFPMVRPPCMRLGSVRPSNPRSTCTKGRATGSPREHDV